MINHHCLKTVAIVIVKVTFTSTRRRMSAHLKPAACCKQTCHVTTSYICIQETTLNYEISSSIWITVHKKSPVKYKLQSAKVYTDIPIYQSPMYSNSGLTTKNLVSLFQQVENISQHFPFSYYSASHMLLFTSDKATSQIRSRKQELSEAAGGKLLSVIINLKS